MSAAQILTDAAAVVGGNAADRDLGKERSMARTVKAFNILTGHNLSERDGWMFMVFLKAARACTTPTGKADDYLDLSAYGALAGESVEEPDPQIELPLTGVSLTWIEWMGAGMPHQLLNEHRIDVLLESGDVLENRQASHICWTEDSCVKSWRLAQPEKSVTVPVTKPGDKL